MDWPGNSLNFDPTENSWNIMGFKTSEVKSATTVQLQKLIMFGIIKSARKYRRNPILAPVRDLLIYILIGRALQGLFEH